MVESHITNHKNAMKRRNILLVLLLWATTGGIYSIYWLYKVGVDSYRANESNRLKRMIPVAIVVLILMQVTSVVFVLGIGIEELKGAFIWFFIFAFVCALLVYSLSFVLVHDVAKALCNAAGNERLCSPKLAVILTLFGFASIVYLQASINKRLGVSQ